MQRVEEQINSIYQDLCALVTLVGDSFNELLHKTSESVTEYEKIRSRVLGILNEIKNIFTLQANPELKRAGESVHFIYCCSFHFLF
jgi:ElaB/YqjD/DUF883 family membrane-anchored ribosome-binding protein